LTEKLKELTDKRSHIPVFPEGLKAEALAQEFRKHLNLQLLKSQKPNNLLTCYKDELEKSLNIVIVEYPLKAEDVRAFSISSDICSIVLNEDDNPRIKLFSLFHEVCHILKKTDGICSLDIEKQKSGIEAFCNNFAAGFLVPIQDLKTEVEKYPTIDNSAINELADIYCVSKQVIMIRLLKAGYIDEETYELYKKGIEEKAKQGGYGRKQWEKIYLNRIGHFTLQETKAAYNEGKITFADFLRILDLKAKYGEKYIL
jgi:Zn-dependent peptidase ImmA (M78 family)